MNPAVLSHIGFGWRFRRLASRIHRFDVRRFAHIRRSVLDERFRPAVVEVSSPGNLDYSSDALNSFFWFPPGDVSDAYDLNAFEKNSRNAGVSISRFQWTVIVTSCHAPPMFFARTRSTRP